MRTKLPWIVMTDYSDALARYGPGSPELANVYQRYEHLEGFREYAQALDTIKRALVDFDVDFEPLLQAADGVPPCRILVRAGAKPSEARRLSWRIGVGLIRLGVWLLGDRASFQRYDLRKQDPNFSPENQHSQHNEARVSETLIKNEHPLTSLANEFCFSNQQ